MSPTARARAPTARADATTRRRSRRARRRDGARDVRVRATARRDARGRDAIATALAALAMHAATRASAITENQMLYLEAWRAVDKAYVDKTFNGNNWFKLRERGLKTADLDDTEATYGTIREMLGKLGDPFTQFLEPEKYASVTDRTMRADVSGVGVEMGFGDDAKVVVVAPTPGGPSAEAGVKAKDFIVAVDGAATRGKSLYEVADELQGPQGSKVTLTLERDGKTRDVAVQRKRYTVVPVTSATCEVKGDKKIGYVKLSAFNQVSGAKTKEALAALKADGVDVFVLDLRDNVGGLFPGALEIAKAFMNEGTIVYIADSNGERDVFQADRTALDAATPLKLLVNKGTASASEVLSGALQDNKRAIVLGEQTFGKGLIQTLVPLSDGSAVSVTVAQYRTPNGTDINKIGITPDAPLPLDASGADIVPSNAADFCAYAREAPELFIS
jgi:C-terminal peptidase prc